MRVLLVNGAGQRIGGIEIYLKHLMPALLRRGHQVSFLYQHAFVDGAETLAPPGTPSWCVERSSPVSILEEVRRWQPDVVYVHERIDLALLGRILHEFPAVWFGHAYSGACVSGSRCWSRPNFHPCDRDLGWGCLALYFPRRCGGRNPATMWKLFREHRAFARLLARFDVRLTHSEYTRGLYLRQGLPPDSTRSIPFLVPGEPGARHRDPREIAAGPLRLLFLGRFDPYKGVPLLLDALPDVARELARPVHLALAGDGPERARWERHAADARSSASKPGAVDVTFLGWVGGNARTAAISDADLVIVPSVWPEPFGMTGIEAGRHGVPAVAFDVGGVRAWLVPGSNGELAPGSPPTSRGLGAAILRATKDPAHYARLCVGARRCADGFTEDAHLDPLLAALGEARERRRRSGGRHAT